MHLFKWFLGFSKYRLRVTYFDYELAGFCLMIGNRIDRLIVDEMHHGKGIGTGLVPDYADFVKTPITNRKAIGFYKLLGFKKDQVYGFVILRRGVEKYE